MGIAEAIAKIQTTPGCQVFPPNGLPTIQKEHLLPDDLRHFYTLCGGLHLFEEADCSVTIVPPTEVVLANPVIVGKLAESVEDISWSWYLIAHDDNGDFLTIDLSHERSGRCYDSCFEVHAVAGSCPIIARSFTDLLTRLYENSGQYWYWLRPDFVSLGDAYDEAEAQPEE